MIISVEKGIIKMKKSVYSLVLNDEVVRAIDMLAYKSGSNRSSTVNRILAEYISLTTPEMRIAATLEQLMSLISACDSFRLMPAASDSVMSLSSPLVYKYNPSVKYAVELYLDDSDAIGELRVTMRTQNSALIMALIEFYKLWNRIETARIGAPEASADSYGRYTRKLRPRINRNLEPTLDTAAAAQLISDYIRVFDEALKAFFYNMNEPALAVMQIEKIYNTYLGTSPQII